MSAIAALIIFGLVRLILEWPFALFAASPFIGIGLYGAFQQLRRPSAKRIAATLDRARAMPVESFLAALEEGFRREGYGVSREAEGADLRITRSGLVTLVACKRWKVVRTGVEPLREFDAASGEAGAHGRVYVAVGEVTDTARAFAVEKKIRLMQEEELVRLLR